MVHQYKSNGYNIVLDVCSGSVHVVDDLVYDIIANYENHTKEQVNGITGHPMIRMKYRKPMTR